jgi:hypothetical protein
MRFAIVAMTRTRRFTLIPCKEAASIIVSTPETLVRRLGSPKKLAADKNFYGAKGRLVSATQTLLMRDTNRINLI